MKAQIATLIRDWLPNVTFDESKVINCSCNNGYSHYEYVDDRVNIVYKYIETYYNGTYEPFHFYIVKYDDKIITQMDYSYVIWPNAEADVASRFSFEIQQIMNYNKRSQSTCTTRMMHYTNGRYSESL